MSEFETGAAATAGEEYKTETWLDASCFVKAKPEGGGGRIASKSIEWKPYAPPFTTEFNRVQCP